jgi:pimeloyl-ACP methyl ester carboxylesterase
MFKHVRRFGFSCIALVTITAAVTRATEYAETSPLAWLCRPGTPNDPCTAPRTATVVLSGKISGVETTERDARAAGFDCFYVYPTVSAETSDNADLLVHKEERGIATDEASRFSEACNVWVPIYRQITSTTQDQGRYDTAAYGDVAYASVLAAWREYHSKYNNGRPVVFIGHSQGTQMISRLLRQEIEPSPALRKQVLLAILVGGNVAVADAPGGRGSFAQIPACRAAGQTGCVIGYSIYSEPPPTDSRFGIPGQGASFQGKQFARTGVHIICTNPSALSGGTGALDTYLRTVASPHAMAAKETAAANVTTPWVEYRGLFSAECRRRGNATWLNVTRNGPANGYPRLFVEAAKFGLHNYDVMLPLGNLVDDVKAAEATYSRVVVRRSFR